MWVTTVQHLCSMRKDKNPMSLYLTFADWICDNGAYVKGGEWSYLKSHPKKHLKHKTNQLNTDEHIFML